ncbi:ABC transporter permease [Propionimicrobium lymphophilum]|uniref:ABC transporter permease n=1 Tax=Propionimicrobium lymphophilum TaxID=33012 RepID=UPI0004027AD3|nr:ABC transporter permease [Propionimicrobium lymphophilum]
MSAQTAKATWGSRLRLLGIKILSLFVSLVAASLVVFLLVNLLPGDVAGVILGQNADPTSVAALRETMNLDQPWPARYLAWVGGLLQGDLGSSIFTSQPISMQLGRRLGVTFSLVILGMLFAVGISLPLGAYAAARRNKATGVAVSILSQLGMAVPAFLAGLLLVIVFAVWLGWLPANGYIEFRTNPLMWARNLVLPVASLAMVQGAILTRYTRSAFVEVLNQDYFRTARAVGWRFRPAIIRHGIRNASLQVITVLGLQLASLLVGSIVVERVFSLPGLGSYLIAAVGQRDLPVVQSVVMILVALVLIINTVVDIIYHLLDPRLKAAEGVER